MVIRIEDGHFCLIKVIWKFFLKNFRLHQRNDF